MWLFLSSRLRTWLLLAVAVPVLRRVVHRVAARQAGKDPDSRSAAALRRADSALGALAGRRSQRRHGR